MYDHTKKKVIEIKKGDFIKSWQGKQAKVLAVVKILTSNQTIPMVHFENGLVITPRHPVFL